MPFHSQLRGSTNPQSKSERATGIDATEHHGAEPVVERGYSGQQLQRFQRQFNREQCQSSRTDRRLAASCRSGGCRGDPLSHENQLVEYVQQQQQ